MFHPAGDGIVSMVPAVGAGVIGIQARSADSPIMRLLGELSHPGDRRPHPGRTHDFVRAHLRGDGSGPATLGSRVAADLLHQGARRLITATREWAAQMSTDLPG
ncbi:hypothetical protein GCM10022419_116310 [Nonomuraea rosea]|uniref:Pyrroline-5-carboxylate reductase dimerisation domain-containing protein n=1 Tax=Nonomuraea rosea TaxID=638574 RepID=A0ABP6ZJU7_9ACTN